MPVWNFVWKSAYHDSVTLMRLAQGLEGLPGVVRAAAMMATPANLALLGQAGLLADSSEAARPTDLVIAVTADDAAPAEAAEALARATLESASGPAAPAARPRPRTLGAGLRALPDATLALISVPGAYAGAEAAKALRAGLDVMLYSDNVPLETEVALKRLARARGRLVMGPDCGTAIVHGVPLGFANAVPRGRIGLAAASGTGLQEVVCLVAAAGEGISQAIGVGGRDLSDAVGGLAMEQALDVLASDPTTEVLGVIGKPPEPRVAERIAALASGLGKPCVAHFVGRPTRQPGRLHLTATLEDCALAAVALARGETPRPVEFTAPNEARRLAREAASALTPAQRFVRGVYSGGTLAWEALHLLDARLDDVAPGVRGGGQAHRVVDLGDDAFTVGRPHPMIDGALRRERIVSEGRDPSTAVLLLDIVLGHGAHADPAADLLPAIEAARAEARRHGGALAVVASVCGTDADPQNRGLQAAKLAASGVVVMPSNAQAARLAALIARERAGPAG